MSADSDDRRSADRRANESMAQLGQLAALIAHEVKNPLAGISGALQVLVSRMDPTGSDARVLKDVIGRVKQLDEVLASLIDFSRVPRPVVVPCQLREIAGGVLGQLQSRKAFAGFDFVLEGPEITVLADPLILERALSNLVINSVQAFSEQGGDVRPTVRVRVAETHDEATVSVIDNGPGLPDVVRADLFRPFFTTKVTGAGLGLAIVKQAMEAHGGWVEAESKSGLTRFTLVLPKGRDPR